MIHMVQALTLLLGQEIRAAADSLRGAFPCHDDGQAMQLLQKAGAFIQVDLTRLLLGL